ncbi:carboxypeptidase M32 [Deinococcus maricopensis]|uniref:Metal-dependent carboxypeptidase n=1 Tax=Deinococcus maricopensis (strain DSM 21211 / LMG 22137 / NRRL B-23946 / LB-34) TaxID=709986 RepID=E8U578_DEIML|nr:carboxypeptidase M32 [Deinococcus maricopensis]ADV66217.1 Carboxypeptidase Taq [Deinococcus maricopensis DSM 21211]
MTQLDDLKTLLGQVSDLSAAASLMSWDQETYMPPEAARVRSLQMATLAGLSHETFTNERTGQLLDAAERNTLSDTDAAIVRVARRDYTKATKLPTSFVEELTRAQNEAHHAWIEARKTDSFNTFAPYLERMFDLARRQADLVGFDAHPYDALIDDYEPGARAEHIRSVFADLRDRTLPLLRRITAAGDATDYGVLSRPFPAEAQRNIALRLAEEAFGLKPAFSRLDVSAHPFQTNFSRSDLRITTRFDETYFPTSLYGVWHETGHAMYERGVGERWERTPVSRGASLGVHESQSRMFENLLGRSRAFWQRYFPTLQAIAPDVAAGVDAEALYRAVNRVQPSLIRVEADEVTYNFHIMLRFELELALLEGTLKVADLPEAWNAKMGEYLGITPPNDADGVLQDVHWSAGLIGYFPTYTLGNLLSVQLLNTARQDAQIAAGVDRAEYGPLLAWLAEHVHQYGRSLTPSELTVRATGRELQADDYVAYLHAKYEDIYGLKPE